MAEKTKKSTPNQSSSPSHLSKEPQRTPISQPAPTQAYFKINNEDTLVTGKQPAYLAREGYVHVHEELIALSLAHPGKKQQKQA